MSVFLYICCLGFFAMAVLASRAQARAQKRYNYAMERADRLERELIDAKRKAASYRGKIGSLSRKLKEQDA